MVFLHYVFQDRPSDHWHRTLVQGLKAQLNEGWPEVIVRTLRAAQVATLGQKLQQPVRRAASEPGSRTHRPEVGGTAAHGLQDIQTPGQGLCPRRWRVNRARHSGAVSCHVLLLGSYPHTSPRTSDPIPIMRRVLAISGQAPHLVRESRVTGPQLPPITEGTQRGNDEYRSATTGRLGLGNKLVPGLPAGWHRRRPRAATRASRGDGCREAGLSFGP